MRVIAFGWVQTEPDKWDRYLIRKSTKGDISTDRLHWVNIDYPLCMHCFGQDIEVRPEIPAPYMLCLTCGEYCPNDPTSELQPEESIHGNNKTI